MMIRVSAIHSVVYDEYVSGCIYKTPFLMNYIPIKTLIRLHYVD